MTITVNFATFMSMFPYFSSVGATQAQVNAAYQGAGSYISTKENSINLVLSMQTRGVYLATAHILYLQFNPSTTSIINSASQGTESAGFQQKPVKNWKSYNLGMTIYGMELLSILESVQPPSMQQQIRLTPYYNSTTNLTRI